MQIRESMHHQINALNIEQLLIVQEFLAALGAEKTKLMPVALPQPYVEVRAALSTKTHQGVEARFFGLHQTDDGVVIDQGSSIDDIGDIAVLDEELEQSDRFLADEV